MIPAFFAIAITPFYPIWLYIYGLRPWIPITVINLVFAFLFVLAFKYLAPYIFRVALSNRRIRRFADGKVTFSYRDSGSGDIRFHTLGAEEFIRRFLQHVLQKGFVKVLYTMASSARGNAAHLL